MRKSAICICEKKGVVQPRGSRALVFATYIVQSLYILDLNFYMSIVPVLGPARELRGIFLVTRLQLNTG